MPSADTPLMTPAELSTLLNDVPETTLAQWRSKGTGPAYHKVGVHVRYRAEDVETWLATRRRNDTDLEAA